MENISFDLSLPFVFEIKKTVSKECLIHGRELSMSAKKIDI